MAIVKKIVNVLIERQDKKQRERFYEVFGCYPEEDDIYTR